MITSHLSLRALVYPLVFLHITRRLSLLFSLPYLRPIAITAPEMASHVKPFRENPSELTRGGKVCYEEFRAYRDRRLGKKVN